MLRLVLPAVIALSSCVPLWSQTTTATRPAGRVVQFADGVTIDWGRREVAVDAQVVLREGILELLACAPRSKEHESIMSIRARPLHVYQALGLLGLPDGTPARFDAATGRAVPSGGATVEVELRYQRDGKTCVDDARQWLMSAPGSPPMPPSRWLFVGRAPDGERRFGADVYGTVLTLLPFPTSLVLLVPAAPSSGPTSRSVTPAPSAAAASRPADDEGVYVNTPDDWQLVPDPKRVPPIGTEVVIVIRPVREGAWLRLDRFGRVWFQGEEVGLDDLPGRLAAGGVDLNAVRLEFERGAIRGDVEALRALLRIEGTTDPRVHPVEAMVDPGERVGLMELLSGGYAWRGTALGELSMEVDLLASQLAEQRASFERTVAAIRSAIVHWDEKVGPPEPR